MAVNQKMLTGDIKKSILGFAFPIFLSQLFQQLYNSVDSLIVGNFLGKEALASVSSSGTLIFLLTSLFVGVAMGAGVVISRYYGAGNYKRVSDAIHTNIAFGLAAGIALTIFAMVATPSILRWMKTDPHVLPGSILYFRCYFSGAVAMVMYNIFNGIMNAVGDSRRPLYYLIFSSILNVILDLLFIGVFKFGIGSAAIATAIAQACSALLALFHLMRTKEVYHVSLRNVRFHKSLLKEIVCYGLPTGIQNSVIGFANVIVQSNINSFGTNAMASYGSYVKVEGFAFLPITCFSMALTTFIGQNLGARQYQRAKKGASFGIITSVLLAECLGIAIFTFAPQLIRMFSNDTQVIALGVKQARVEALFYFLLAFSHCIAGICRGAGKAVIPMAVMLAIWCVLRICYISIMMQWIHEIQYIYWAYPLTWSISSVIYLLYYKYSDWIHGFERA